MLDSSLYMVLPFRHRAQSAPLLLNGDQCESLLHDALARWQGVQMVDPLWVADARSRHGASSSIEDGVAIARERRAGRVVLGEVWQFRDTIHVRGLLYDAAGKRLVREQSVRIAPDLSDAQVRFQDLADSLLTGGGVATGPPPRNAGQFSLPAWRAFQEGYAALQRWDLDSAKAKLRKALTLDPNYGAAQLWLAQTLAWAGEHGIDATGGVSADTPLTAAADELRRFPADEVIVSTHPERRSRWLESGLVERLRDELEIPVHHVVVDLERVHQAARR